MSTRKPNTQQNVPHHIYRTPIVASAVRSVDRFQNRPSYCYSGNAVDLPPTDPQARFSISYVQGMSEHVVNTGKTLQEAQLKVVLFACEVERLNTLNYNLVKENEIIKAQKNKTDREKDLEVKLSIVLAENEKLIQVVEELYEAYQQIKQTHSQGYEIEEHNGISDSHINEIMRSIDNWRQNRNNLEKPLNMTENIVTLQNTRKELERENQTLTERLARQDKDLESLRARFASFEKRSGEGKVTQQNGSDLVIENQRLKRELDAMRLQYGSASALQLKLKDYDDKIRILLHQNEKLNEVLSEKITELKEVRNSRSRSPMNVREMNITPWEHTGQKEIEKSSARSVDADVKLQELMRENASATQEIERLNAVIRKMRETIEQLQATAASQQRGRVDVILKENDRLNLLLGDKLRELEDLRTQLRLTSGGNARIDELSAQVSTLLGENRRLHEALTGKILEIDGMRKQIKDAEERLSKIDKLEEKIILVTSENQRLNIVLDNKMIEADQLKKQVDETMESNVRLRDLRQQVARLLEENNKLNEIVDHIKSELDTQKIRNYELENRSDFSIQQKEQIDILNIENRRLGESLYDKIQETEKLRRRIGELEMSSGGFSQIREQMSLLTEERDRLSDMLDERVREVEALRNQIEELRANETTEQLRNQLSAVMLERDRLNIALGEKITESNSLRIQLERSKGDFKIDQLSSQVNNLADNNKRIREVESLRNPTEELRTNETTEQLKNKLLAITIERDRLNIALGEKITETDHLRMQLEQPRGDFKMDQLSSHVNNLADENRKLREVVAERTRETEGLRRRLSELEGVNVSQLKSQLAIVKEERDRLDKLAEERLDEIVELRREAAESKGGNTRTEQESEQIIGLLNENERLNELVLEKAEELESSKKRVAELEHVANVIDHLQEKIILVTGENDRLNSVLTTKLEELEILKAKNEGFKESGNKIQQLTLQLNGLLEENRKLNDLLTEKLEEIEKLKNRGPEYSSPESGGILLREQMQALTEEKNRLNGLLFEKIVENEKLKQRTGEPGGEKLEQYKMQINALMEENHRLNDLVTEKMREVDLLRLKTVEYEPGRNVGGELREQLEKLAADNEMMNRMLADRMMEIDKLNKQMSESSYAGERLERLTGQMNIILHENTKLNDLVSEKTGQVEKLRENLKEAELKLAAVINLRDQLAALTEEKEKLNIAHADKFMENDSLKQKIELLESERERLDGELGGLRDENRRYSELLNERTGELEALRRKVLETNSDLGNASYLRNQTAVLTEEKEKLNIDNLNQKIELLESERERLDGELGGLRDENRRYSELLNERTGELEALRRKVLEMGSGLGNVSYLRNQTAVLTEEKEKLSIAHADKFMENDNLKQKIELLESERERLDGELGGLRDENRRYSELLNERTGELEALRRKVLEMDSDLGNASYLRDQVERIISEKEKLNVLLAGKELEVDGLKKEIEDMKTADETEILKAHIGDLEQENKRLIAALIERREELDTLKKKLADIESVHYTGGIRENMAFESLGSYTISPEKVNETEILRNQVEEAKNLSNYLTSQVNELSNEKRKLNEQYTSKLLEVENLREEIEKHKHSTDINKGLIEKVSALTEEVERLKFLVNNRNSESDHAKNRGTETRSSTLEPDYSVVQGHGVGYEKHKMGNFSVLGTDTTEEPGRRFSENEMRLTQQQDLLVNIVLLSSEVERLGLVLDKKNREIELIQAQLYDVRSSSESFSHLRFDTPSMSNDNKKLNDMLAESMKENEALKIRIIQLEALGQSNPELNERLDIITAENNRLNSLIANKVSENEDLKRRSEELQHTDTQISNLLFTQKQIGSMGLAEERDRLDVERMHELEANMRMLEDENEHFKQINSEVTKDLEETKRKYAEMRARWVESEESKTNLIFLTQENERLSGALQEKTREIETLRHQQFVSFKESGTQSSDIQDRLNSLVAENERLRQDVLNKTLEVEDLKGRVVYPHCTFSSHEDIADKLVLVTAENQRLMDLLEKKNFEPENPSPTEIKAAGSLKEKIEMLMSENERLDNLLNEKVQEVKVLKRDVASPRRGEIVEHEEEHRESANILHAEIDRLTHLLTEKVSETEDLKAKIFELQSRSQEPSHSFYELQKLREENEKLVKDIEIKSREVDDLRNRLSSPRSSLHSYEANTFMSGEKNKSVNNPVGALTPQVRQTLSPSAHRNENVQDMEARIALLTSDNQRLENIVREKLHEIEEIRNYSPYKDDIKMMNQELEEKVTILSTEIDRMNTLLTEKVTEFEDLKAKNIELENFVQQASHLSTENENLKQIVAEQENSANTLQFKVFELEQKLAETQSLKEEVHKLTEENQSLTRGLQSKSQDIEDLRSRLVSPQGNLQSYEDIAQKLAFTIAENERLANLVRVHSTESRTIQDLEAKITSLVSDNERLEKLVQGKDHELEVSRREQFASREEMKAKNEELEEKNTILTGEIDRVNNILTQKVAEYEDIKAKNIELQQQTSCLPELEQKLTENHSLKEEVHKLTEENQSLSSSLQSRLEEIEDLKSRLVSPQGNLQSYEEIAQKLSFTIAENERLANLVRVHSTESRTIQDLEAKITSLVSDNERLEKLVQGKDHELEVSRREQFASREEMKAKNEELEEKNTILTGEIDRVNNILTQKVAEYEDIKAKNIELQQQTRCLPELEQKLAETQSLKEEVHKLTEENQSLTRGLQSKSQEIEDLKSQLGSLQENMQSYEDITQKLALTIAENERLANLLHTYSSESQNIQDLEANLVLLSSENERLVAEIERKNLDIYNLSSQLRNLTEALNEHERNNSLLKSKIVKLELDAVEIQNLKCQTSKLEEEIRSLTADLQNKTHEVEHFKHLVSSPEGDLHSYEEVVEKLAQLTAENDRLNNIVQAKSAGSPKSIQELEGKILLLASDNEVLEKILKEKDGEIEEVKKDRDEVKAIKEELDEKTTILTGEIDRVNKLLTEKVSEVELLKDKGNQLESHKQDIPRLYSRNHELTQTVLELETNIMTLKQKVDKLETGSVEVDNLKSQVLKLTEENDKFKYEKEEALNLALSLQTEKEQLTTTIVEQKSELELLTEEMKLDEKLQGVKALETHVEAPEEPRDKITVIQDKIKRLVAENERLDTLLQDNSKEVGKLNMEYSSEKNETQKRIEELQERTSLLNAENGRLNNFLTTKVAEVEELKVKVTELEERKDEAGELSEQNKNLTRQVNELEKKAGDLEKKVKELEQGSVQMQNVKNKIAEENERLIKTLEEKEQNVSNITSLNQELEKTSILTGEIDRVNNLLTVRVAEIESLKAKMVELESERGGNADNLQSKEEELERNSLEIKNLKGQLNKATEENENLAKSIQEKSEEIEQFRAADAELQERIRLITEENKRLNSMLTQRISEAAEGLQKKNTEISSLSTENKNLSQRVAEYERNISQLQQRITELEQGPGELEGLREQLGKLSGENENLTRSLEGKSLEADDWRNKFFEAQRDSYQTGELKTRLQTLQSDNERLNKLIAERSRELEEINRKYAELQANSRLVDEVRTNHILVTQDNERLNNLLQEKLREIEMLRQCQIEDLEPAEVIELKDRIKFLENENKRLKEALQARPEEAGELKIEQYQLEGTFASGENQQEKKKSAITGLSSTRDGRSSPHTDLEYLYREIERLNKLLKERNSESENIEGSSDTIREARMKAQELEERLRIAQEQIELLNRTLHEKILEIENLSMERSYHQETGEIRETSTGSDQIEELMQENLRLNRLLMMKEKQIQELASKSYKTSYDEEKFKLEDEYKVLLEEQMTNNTRRFAAERQALEGEIEGLRQKEYELEEKLRVLGEDNHKLSAINDQRLHELDEWRQRYELLERQKEYEMEELREQSDERLREEVDQSTRVMTDGPEAVIGELRKNKLKLEKQVDGLSREIMSLREALESSSEEIGAWRNKYSELESLRGQEIKELRKQFENFRKSNIETKEFQMKFAAERAAYETQLLQLQQKIMDLENQVELLTAENERMIAINMEKMKEVEFWKKKYTQNDEAYALEMGELKIQLEMLKSNNYDVKQLAIKYSAEKAADQSQIRQLKQMNENYAAELDKLYELMNQRKIDFDALTKQNEELRRMYERLIQQVKGQDKENFGSQERYQILQKEMAELAYSRDQYKRQAERNSIELTKKNKELVEKLQELDILKLKYEDALANYQTLNNQFKHYLKLFDRFSVEHNE